MKNNKTHALLLALVAGYIGYIAYHLWENMRAGANEMPEAAYILLIAVFALATVGILIYAGLVWKKAQRQEKAEKAREAADSEENNNSAL